MRREDRLGRHTNTPLSYYSASQLLLSATNLVGTHHIRSERRWSWPTCGLEAGQSWTLDSAPLATVVSNRGYVQCYFVVRRQNASYSSGRSGSTEQLSHAAQSRCSWGLDPQTGQSHWCAVHYIEIREQARSSYPGVWKLWSSELLLQKKSDPINRLKIQSGIFVTNRLYLNGASTASVRWMFFGAAPGD